MMLNSSSAEQSQSVTLTVADWQTIFAGLYELPAKFSVPVITRLQAQLHRMPDEDEPMVNRGLGSLNGGEAAAASGD